MKRLDGHLSRGGKATGQRTETERGSEDLPAISEGVEEE